MLYRGPLGSEYKFSLQWVSINLLSNRMSQFFVSVCVLGTAAVIEIAQLWGAYFWGNIFRENRVLKFAALLGVCLQAYETFEREQAASLCKRRLSRAAFRWQMWPKRGSSRWDEVLSSITVTGGGGRSAWHGTRHGAGSSAELKGLATSGERGFPGRWRADSGASSAPLGACRPKPRHGNTEMP